MELCSIPYATLPSFNSTPTTSSNWYGIDIAGYMPHYEYTHVPYHVSKWKGCM
jgi:hypothetical protein